MKRVGGMVPDDNNNEIKSQDKYTGFYQNLTDDIIRLRK